MKLKKILLAATVGAAAFSATNLYAENTSPIQQQTKEQNFEIKSLLDCSLKVLN